MATANDLVDSIIKSYANNNNYVSQGPATYGNATSSSLQGVNGAGAISAGNSTAGDTQVKNTVMGNQKGDGQSWGDYWNSLGYDKAAGEKLAYAAQTVGGARGTVGYCATGVAESFNSVYGTGYHGNGNDWDTNMADRVNTVGDFAKVDISGMSIEEQRTLLQNLPAGAVVTWDEQYDGASSEAGQKYGHVTIADGNGGEYSDHYSANIYTNRLNGSAYKQGNLEIYIPITA